MVLAVVATLTGIMIIIQAGPAYAVSAEKVSLVQQSAQFVGQEVTGFCNVKLDDEGNLHWHIKVHGLVPGTIGHFDMNHWAGEIDVPFTADENGNANSDNQIVLAADVPNPKFTQFAACHVGVGGGSHNYFSVIATAEVETI